MNSIEHANRVPEKRDLCILSIIVILLVFRSEGGVGVGVVGGRVVCPTHGSLYAHHRHLSSSSLGILPDAAVSLTVGGHMASHILFFSAAPESVPGVASG